VAFFDKKEDVLDIELTPYGRHLLSQGKLKPAYYAFLDDDVVYDDRSALGKTERITATKESNHLIKDRIINETPSLKPFTSFNSVETTIKEKIRIVKQSSGDPFSMSPSEFGAIVIPEVIFKDHNFDPNTRVNNYLQNYKPLSDVNSKFLQNTIGTSDHAKKNAPYWDVFMIRKEIDTAALGIESTVSGAYEYRNDIDTPSLNQNIPQINQTIEYTISVKNEDTTPFESSIDIVTPQTDANGHYFQIIDEQIIAQVLEKNAFILNETFDIEVFIKNEEVGGSNNWKKLKFKEKKQRIQKDILLDAVSSYSSNTAEDKETVEHYFNLFVDDEIGEEEICKGVNELTSQGLGTPDLNIKCKEYYPISDTTSQFNTPEDCEEECPPGYTEIES